MADYDPQVRRSRPLPSEQSPVDDLLGAAGPSHLVADPALIRETGSGDSQVKGESSGVEEDQVRPFDTPPVEIADERADLVHRFGVLAAVGGLVALLALWRRRRRHD